MKAEHRELLEELRSARRVLVVDDHPSFRRCAAALLAAEGFEVVGEAEDGSSALAAVSELEPDFVLLDVQLPDMDGFEVTKRLLAERPALLVVLVSSRDRSQYGSLVEKCGARGFVSKGDLSGAALASVLE
ncbi:MAG TPA: response regulator transcription factor [Gaiellaceae bacterium]